jgi:uncharacterized protein (DUF433 family)
MVSLLSRITIDPEICHGKPVIRGLRYPVESMIEYLAAGDSIDDLLMEFPDLEREDLLACLEFAVPEDDSLVEIDRSAIRTARADRI